MTAFKIVIGIKSGKCLQKELTEEESSGLIGKKIGDAFSGDSIGFAGYEFKITGGSDACGFPMRRDIDGPIRKRIFAVKGVGLKQKGKGIKVRKTVCGNTVHGKISQINLKVVKEGKTPLLAKEEKKEEKKTKAKTEEKLEKKEEKPKEIKKEVKVEKKEEKKEKEAPKEEVKEEKVKEKPTEPKKEEKVEPKKEVKVEKKEEKPTEPKKEVKEAPKKEVPKETKAEKPVEEKKEEPKKE